MNSNLRVLGELSDTVTFFSSFLTVLIKAVAVKIQFFITLEPFITTVYVVFNFSLDAKVNQRTSFLPLIKDGEFYLTFLREERGARKMH